MLWLRLIALRWSIELAVHVENAINKHQKNDGHLLRDASWHTLAHSRALLWLEMFEHSNMSVHIKKNFAILQQRVYCSNSWEFDLHSVDYTEKISRPGLFHSFFSNPNTRERFCPSTVYALGFTWKTLARLTMVEMDLWLMFTLNNTNQHRTRNLMAQQKSNEKSSDTQARSVACMYSFFSFSTPPLSPLDRVFPMQFAFPWHPYTRRITRKWFLLLRRRSRIISLK